MNKDHLDSRCESCIIRELNSFNALNKEDSSKISDVKQVISFKKGEQVFIEGQKLKGVYCIKSGNTKLSKISDNGNSQIIKIARKGELLGKRSLISLQLGESFLPIGSVIRSADLILSYDTTLTSLAYNVIIDPIENDSMYVDSTDVYDLDPFEAIGYPYRVSTDSEKGSCILSIKDILQNITLGNVDNLGFKLIANEKNDPFEFIQFEKNNDMRIEIIYVSN